MYKAFMFINGSKLKYLTKLILRKLKGIISFLVIVAIIIAIIIIFGVKLDSIGLLIVGFVLGKSNTFWNYIFGKKENVEKSISLPWKRPEFNSEIVEKKGICIRGIDSITFRSKYKGKLKNGYFGNTISMPDVNPEYQYKYLFTPETPNVSKDLKTVKSYCSGTIDNSTNSIGKLNGNIDSDWVSWKWEIRGDIAPGKYYIKMMVFNGGIEERPLQTIEDEIEIGNPIEKVDFR